MITFIIEVFTGIILISMPFHAGAQETDLPETETDPVLATVDLDTVRAGNYFSPAIISEFITRFDSIRVWVVISDHEKRIDARLLYTLRDFDFSGLTRTLIDDNWMERESDRICRLHHDNGKIVFAGPMPEGIYTLQLRIRGFNPDLTAFSEVVPFRNFLDLKK